MKYILLTIILFVSLTTFAGTSTTTEDEVLQVANVILDNPKASAAVKKENLNIVEYSITPLNADITKFTFQLARTCYCIPKTGVLTIIQDRHQTYYDGPIIYKVNLKIGK